ncbi:hypothetical protein LA5095_00987 [Roseibium album]|uniref:Uncharacterized protein n=1 Tax=Roseibium album TaxID=311410 RepID=A0A0M6ZDL0_9HYPH|nr:hypothetical protein LA5094_02984 [Roseibium album]CTQ66895.1 hypothetical protein LA5095_00987 [Roseibium album]CTQ74640.1 hypothetical protein LA5096_04125 [Roseibium album]
MEFNRCAFVHWVITRAKELSRHKNTRPDCECPAGCSSTDYFQLKSPLGESE